ncbi:conserved hypothetical protein [Theileria orientalis strain Shintoku]|uniref:Signal peptidase n=1 Tax=Theileria orientalis strain Shintoku TaxID=869250 RepID=J4DQ90_THEOR|nr:conserved hypothetical protein [Theileria orientalis strain Shintoku]PVC51402.1 hypothetical protein MACL_00001584 [Theileria orientalis]BAM42039.1 conserved hypothetical protein [Theileria orientalis strain Shintoku]|eukprot:XP_009692340.1 conserved hypothetical protein [Theileria orientalis strain Shintoku]
MLNNKFINKFATKNLGLLLLGTFISNNFITLRVIEEDNMNPVLSHGPIYNDIVVVLRASKYHKNDIIMYKNPNTGKESFGRLTSFNTDETLGAMSSKIPSGHCWYVAPFQFTRLIF